MRSELLLFDWRLKGGSLKKRRKKKRKPQNKRIWSFLQSTPGEALVHKKQRVQTSSAYLFVFLPPLRR